MFLVTACWITRIEKKVHLWLICVELHFSWCCTKFLVHYNATSIHFKFCYKGSQRSIDQTRARLICSEEWWKYQSWAHWNHRTKVKIRILFRIVWQVYDPSMRRNLIFFSRLDKLVTFIYLVKVCFRYCLNLALLKLVFWMVVYVDLI